MSVMSVANQHNVFSSYGAVHMQRQLIPSTALHSQELNLAAQQAAAELATKDEQRAERSVTAAETTNRAQRFDRQTTGNSTVATGESTLDEAPEAAAGATETPARPRDPDQLGYLVDVYL